MAMDTAASPIPPAIHPAAGVMSQNPCETAPMATISAKFEPNSRKFGRKVLPLNGFCVFLRGHDQRLLVESGAAVTVASRGPLSREYRRPPEPISDTGSVTMHSRILCIA